MRLSSVRTDTDKETTGVWVDYEGDCKLLIARIGNKNYQKFIADKQAPLLAQLRGRDQTPEEFRALVTEAVAHTILLDWKNADDDEGKPIPFSTEKALELFRDPSYRDFYRFVLDSADRQEAYRIKKVESASGN